MKERFQKKAEGIIQGYSVLRRIGLLVDSGLGGKYICVGARF